MSKFIEPNINLKSFTCPYCDTLSSVSGILESCTKLMKDLFLELPMEKVKIK